MSDVALKRDFLEWIDNLACSRLPYRTMLSEIIMMAQICLDTDTLAPTKPREMEHQ